MFENGMMEPQNGSVNEMLKSEKCKSMGGSHSFIGSRGLTARPDCAA